MLGPQPLGRSVPASQKFSGATRMKARSVRAAVSAILVMVATAANAVELSDRILSAQVRLTTSLVERLQTRPGETAIVSPAGVAAALALLDVGTDANFRAASQRVLG